MGCNCATNEQLKKLYKQFGYQRELTNTESVWFKIKNFFTKIGVACCLILILPYILFYIIRHGFFGDKRISVAHFLGLREKIVK